MKEQTKNLIVTLVDGSVKKIGIDLLAAVNQKIGAKANDPIYTQFALEVGYSGFIDPETRDTDNPEVIPPSQIYRVKIDLGKNLTYEQEFLTSK